MQTSSYVCARRLTVTGDHTIRVCTTSSCSSLISLNSWRSQVPRHAKVRGGAHLSVAYALGAALPTTLIGRIGVVDKTGDIWSLTGNAPTPNGANRLLESKTSRVFASTGECLVYLDLLPTLSNSAFDDLVAKSGDRFASAVHVRPLRDGNLKPEEAAAITGEASRVIRDLAGRFHNSDVHLLLRCPWTVALLLGRTLNTITCSSVRMGGWPRRPRKSVRDRGTYRVLWCAQVPVGGRLRPSYCRFVDNQIEENLMATLSKPIFDQALTKYRDQ